MSWNPKIKKLINLLNNGEVVIIPTDTVLGILTSEEEKIIQIKNRDRNKKTIVFVSDLTQIDKNIPEDLEKILKKYWPGKLTVIYKGIGYRCPNKSIILKALKKTKKLIYASSANISTKKTAKSIKEAKKIFKDSPIKIHYINSYGWRKNNIPSTIFDYDNKKIIREGEIKLSNFQEKNN